MEEDNQPKIPVAQPISNHQVTSATSPTTGMTSTTSVVALVLGILSLTCCGFFTGIPAIFIGRSEITAIEEKRIHPSNKALATIGFILGIIGTIISCLGALVYAILIALGIATSFQQGGGF